VSKGRTENHTASLCVHSRMDMDRRGFLTAAGVTAAAPTANAQDLGRDWNAVRGQFATSPTYVHMSAMLIASHPRPVRDSIDYYRRQLDANPVTFLEDNNRRLQTEARAAAARYLMMETSGVALTDSTTMGVALIYGGLRLRPGDELLTTEQDYYVTHESLRHAATRSRAVVRRIPLYEDIAAVTPESMAGRIGAAITPRTKVVALTWVHSSTGLKLPIRRIADVVARANATRSEQDQIILAVDGVHGFGNQNETFQSLGCDFFIAGCHKWLFGPRGTGIVAGTEKGWKAVGPIIPSFIDSSSWSGWITGAPGVSATPGSYMSPGGFKAFEHLWALTPAFGFHESIGKARVAARTTELASYLKAGLKTQPHVRLVTPLSPELSAGIVSFDVAGMSADQAVDRLRQKNVVASAAPYATRHVRLTPSIMNTPEEVHTALREIHALA
jgi:isopenicillin-N epimerase